MHSGRISFRLNHISQAQVYAVHFDAEEIFKTNYGSTKEMGFYTIYLPKD